MHKQIAQAIVNEVRDRVQQNLDLNFDPQLQFERRYQEHVEKRLSEGKIPQNKAQFRKVYFARMRSASRAIFKR